MNMRNKTAALAAVTMTAMWIAAAAQPAAAAITVVAHFGMGEGEQHFVGVGGTSTGLFDSIGPSDDMTLIDAAPVSPSVPISTDAAPVLHSSRSMDFAGIDYYQRSSSILGGITTGYLFEAWVKPTSTTTATANDIIFGDGHGGVGKVVFQNGSRYGIGIGGVTFTSGGLGAVTPGVWQHLALVRDASFNGGLTTLLINGSIYHSTAATAGAAAASGVGNQWSGGFEWDGKIDEVYYATTSAFTTGNLHYTSNLVFDNQFNTTWDIDNDGDGVFNSTAATYTPTTAGVSQFAQHGEGQVWKATTLTPQPWSLGGVIFAGGGLTTGAITTQIQTGLFQYTVAWGTDPIGTPVTGFQITATVLDALNNVLATQSLGTTGLSADSTFTFNGNGGLVTLRFALTALGDNGSSDIQLDYVTVTRGAQIPAPAALPAGLAMLGLMAARRRR